ncbi:hypothetical protein MOD31_12425 [Paenarthrobacter sp. TYUT067]|uniref:hypothetical protein n=1 Tax=Paenarthrobacter sp. TYUT067 TaxID=2926245 RepID=UPI00202FA074|nr:hypothetical protein [Paenarthrobacter sp. TYUT067]MCM0616834.1 hypothetical protein [Paenarthrobacter sp. TYUT067]
MSRSTIEDRISRLCSAGILEDVGPQASTGGRPASGYSLSRERHGILALILHQTNAQLALVSAAGRFLGQWYGVLEPGQSRIAFLAEIERAANTLLREHDWNRDDVWAFGVGAGAPWDLGDVRKWASGFAPAVVEEATGAAAIAALDERPGHRDLLYADVGAELQCTLILDGHVVRRPGGGNLSTVVDAAGEKTQYASIESDAPILWDLGRRPGALDSFPDNPDTEAAHNVLAMRQALRASRDAGRAVGLVLAPIISLFNLTDVAVGARNAEREEVLFGIRESLMQCLPAGTLGVLSVEATRSKPLHGITAMALDLALSADCINDRTTT